MAVMVSPGGVLYIVKDVTLVGGPPETWRTEWTRWPAQFQNGQFVVACRSLVSGDATVRLVRSWDTDMEQTVVGTNVTAVNGDIGPFMAVRFLMTTANSRLVVSAYVTAKRE
jgi:hypothetical protein